MRFSKLVFALVLFRFFRLAAQLAIIIVLIFVIELFVIQILVTALAQWRICAVFDVCIELEADKHCLLVAVDEILSIRQLSQANSPVSKLTSSKSTAAESTLLPPSSKASADTRFSFTRSAYRSVFTVWSDEDEQGDTAAIITVLSFISHNSVR